MRRSDELGFLNGHVPVTGILSAIAVVAALLDGRDAVVLSNEWSASVADAASRAGGAINHQWSKGMEFEAGFRQVLAGRARRPARRTSPSSARSPSCGWRASSRS